MNNDNWLMSYGWYRGWYQIISIHHQDNVSSRDQALSIMISTLSLVLLATGALCHLRLDPLVDTKQGLIKGLRADDGDYAMFLGIPYGKVDADNPFGVAQPYPKFDSVFEAFDDTAICPQVEEFNNTIVGTLDCLHLNIYVPNRATSKNKLPVLVWIHGGGFAFGFAGRYLYGPKFIIQHDVILVTLNYRLGPYGFMCLDTPEVAGNQGLKDQVLALRWIKENIEEFGGKSDQVTIFGESAGAVSVELHILSNNEKLYQQAILQSGSVFGDWVVTGSDSTVPSKLATQLGFETDDINDALEFLKTADVKLVIAAASATSFNTRICVEKEYEGVESFLTTHPINIDKIAKAKGIAILTGFNNNELLVDYLNKPVEEYVNLDPFNTLLSSVFDMDKLGGTDRIMRRFYIGDEEITPDVKWDLINFHSDISFNHPVKRSLEKFIDNGAKNVYHYLFSYTGDRNFVKKKVNITEGGAAHADELGYLFDTTILDSTNEDDMLIVERITTMWTNFVKYGNPTPEVTELLPINWPPASKDSLNYLVIDKELIVAARAFSDRMAFWDLFYAHNKHAVKGYVEN